MDRKPLPLDPAEVGSQTVTRAKPRRDVDRTAPDGKIRRECKKCGKWKRLEASNFCRKPIKVGKPGWCYTCKTCEASERRVRRAGEPGQHHALPPPLPRTPPPVLGWCWWEHTAWNPEPQRKRP